MALQMDPERRRKLSELARVHQEWQARHSKVVDPAGPPLARSSHEAHLFMDLHPCPCGEHIFPRASAVTTLPDGSLASRYSGDCQGCGRLREFLFQLPSEPLEAGEEIRYGGAAPSQLLDAGEWLWLADRFAKAVPADPHRLAGAEQRRALGRLAAAAAAIDEVLKFVPPGADSVPASSVWSELGGSFYAREPGRFRVARLVAVRDTYRGLLRRRS